MKIVIYEETKVINGKVYVDGVLVDGADPKEFTKDNKDTPKNNNDDKEKEDDNSGVGKVTPNTNNNKGAQGSQKIDNNNNKGAQELSRKEKMKQLDKKIREGGAQRKRDLGYPEDMINGGNKGAQGSQKTDNKGAQGSQKIDNNNNKGAQDVQKVEPPKINTKSGKELPKPRDVKPGSARERMINRNVEIHGADKIINLRNKNAAFQATRNKKSGYTMDDFVKDFPDSNTAKERRASGGGNHPDLNRVLGRSNSSSKSSTNGDKLDSKTHYTSKIGAFLNNKKVGDPKGSSRHKSVQQIDHNNESYDAYDLVLDYVITEGHAENQDEANYVMMQMTSEQIQHIVSLYEV